MPATPQRRRWRLLLAAMGALLALAFGAVGLLQTRQYELLNATHRYQDDYLVWSLFQFEVEYLRLRLQLEQAANAVPTVEPEQVEQRYEIFVSRLKLIEGEHATKVLSSHPHYRATVERSLEFVAWADQLPLNARYVRGHAAQLREVQARMELLAAPIRELSLTASHHVAAQVTERNQMVQDQSRLSLWLTLLLCALTLGFAWVIVRQFRRLDHYAHEQETLAEHLQSAQRQAEAGSRAKSAFLANMSHELRTPMHGLLGMLGLLRDAPLQAPQQAHLQAAQDSAKHLLAVLNDILDVSKMEAGELSIQPEPVRLTALLRELEELSAPQARAKGLELTLQIGTELPDWVLADPTRLRQILLNLISNAIKFSEHGRVGLRLSREVDALGLELLRFEVSDTGVGMDAGTQARLFQRFSQGDAKRSRRFGGAGLGLEISRNLARAMGGDIHVSSSLGLGSVFTLELRLPACVAPVVTVTAAAEPPPAPRPLHILVSEDNATNRAFLEAVLSRLGHRAEFCENGFDALQRLRAQDFDLVLMDLHTPMMDGFQAARLMRGLPSPKCDVRIVALSADAFEESRERAIASGMDGFLAKPISMEALAGFLGHAAAAEQPAEAGGAEVDLAAIGALRQSLSDATLLHLFRTFLGNVPKFEAALRAALESGNAEALYQAAHSIKGAAANLGLRFAAVPALALELAAKQSATDHAGLRRLTEALLQQLRASAATLQRHQLLS
ncbi:ATP-binding protein [Paucibacter soli]|uniref:ATP-binding protein n=1 Tax=Paucibacter soli TaxID=3133433 RepID=UPI0030974299